MVVVDTAMRYDKRFKAMHRTVVSGSAGPAYLTVPVSTPGTTHCRWDEVLVSGHGEWWRVMQSTMETLYGATPWFHLFKHDLFPLVGRDKVGRSVTDLNTALLVAVRRLAAVPVALSVSLDPRYTTDAGVDITDMRRHDFYTDPEARSVIETLFEKGEL